MFFHFVWFRNSRPAPWKKFPPSFPGLCHFSPWSRSVPLLLRHFWPGPPAVRVICQTVIFQTSRIFHDDQRTRRSIVFSLGTTSPNLTFLVVFAIIFGIQNNVFDSLLFSPGYSFRGLSYTVHKLFLRYLLEHRTPNNCIRFSRSPRFETVSCRIGVVFSWIFIFIDKTVESNNTFKAMIKPIFHLYTG